MHANFYEFIPEDRIEDPAPPVLLAHELEDGKRYYVILSGGNGLYRYDLNDIVEVRGCHNGTPKVAFVRKGRDMVSITGEKLHLNHIQAAIREAERQCRLRLWQFQLIPDAEARRHDLLAELHSPPESDAQGLAFLTAFDRALSVINREYASKRASGRLGPPRLHLMRPGWSERVCRADFASGRREVQYKWPAIRMAWDEASRADTVATLDDTKTATIRTQEAPAASGATTGEVTRRLGPSSPSRGGRDSAMPEVTQDAVADSEVTHG